MDKKIAVYCRVSTDKEQQLNSLENQKSLFQEKIEHDGDELVNVYFDEGLTGTKLSNRKGFNEMLVAAGIDIVETFNKKILENGNYDKRVKQKEINYHASDRKPLFDKIYIKNTSRMFRTTLGKKIINVLTDKGVSIFFLEQNLDTGNSLQEFNLGLFMLLDEQDSRDKSIKVKTGIEESAKKGVIRTNKKIFGYQYNEIDNSLKAIKSESETIKRIFELYSQNFGIRRIIKTLDAEGLYTRSGKSFCKTTIDRILSNEKYYGGNAQLKYATGVVFHKFSYAKVKDFYDVQISDRIEPIISKELFYKCQELMQSKVKDCHAQYIGLSKFAGKVKCLHCGSAYVSDKDGDREFFRCSGKKEKGVSFCSSKNIKKSDLESKLSYDIEHKKLESIYTHLLQSISISLDSAKAIYTNNSSSQLELLKNELSSVNNQLTILFKTYAVGKLPEQIFNNVSDDYNNQIKKLSLKIKELEEPEVIYNKRKSELLIRKQQIENKIKNGFSEQDYLDVLKIRVGYSGRIYFEYCIPDISIDVGVSLKLSRERFNL